MESRLLPGLRAYRLAVFGRGDRLACVFFFRCLFQCFSVLRYVRLFCDDLFSVSLVLLSVLRRFVFIIVGTSVFFSLLLLISLLLISLLFSTLISIELRDWPPAPATHPARTPSDICLCAELPSDSSSSFSSDPLFDLVAITLFGTLSSHSFVRIFR